MITKQINGLKVPSISTEFAKISSIEGRGHSLFDDYGPEDLLGKKLSIKDIAALEKLVVKGHPRGIFTRFLPELLSDEGISFFGRKLNGEIINYPLELEKYYNSLDKIAKNKFLKNKYYIYLINELNRAINVEYFVTNIDFAEYLLKSPELVAYNKQTKLIYKNSAYKTILFLQGKYNSQELLNGRHDYCTTIHKHSSPLHLTFLKKKELKFYFELDNEVLTKLQSNMGQAWQVTNSDLTLINLGLMFSNKESQELTYYHELAHSILYKINLAGGFLSENNIVKYFNPVNTTKINQSFSYSHAKEIFSDLVAAEIFVDDMENNYLLTSSKLKKQYFENSIVDFCTDIDYFKPINRNLGGTHPSHKNRVNKIFFAHPKLQKLYGCTGIKNPNDYSFERFLAFSKK